MAAYSEYKQELDVAIKFYDLAYTELVDLFSSTAVLPPRSKRWTEARVLADAIAYKVCKLSLYLGDHTRVAQTFNAHNRRMEGLCNGWGLGLETAEYWGWLARKNRIFAELLDISETVVVGEEEIEEASKMITGDMILNVDLMLQHPGYYYLLAGECIRQQNSRTVVQQVRFPACGLVC
jgi:trafficking protein particle complex subunit 11